jgi:hypothetical protein
VISNADPKTTFPASCWAASISTPASCAASRICARAASPPSCIWRSNRRAAVSPAWTERHCAAGCCSRRRWSYLERAYNHAKYGEFSAAPAMEITLPTHNDPGLAPAGKHVLSAIVQYAPYELKEGWQRRGALHRPGDRCARAACARPARQRRRRWSC